VGICAGPRMGLDLSGARGVETTALGQVAHQTDNGPYAGEVRAASSVGVGMPLIDRASPGSSYLYYKLLVNDRYAPGAPRWPRATPRRSPTAARRRSRPSWRVCGRRSCEARRCRSAPTARRRGCRTRTCS
jgi:hypothetical protein